MIGGNAELVLKTKGTSKVNEIGEEDHSWEDYMIVPGFLDFMSESTGRNTYNSKIVDSTHVFVCDYVEIKKSPIELRAYCGKQEFDVTYIDDPMNLHDHLEIFLDYLGD